jgi:two-component system OmpR family response regulator
MLRSLRDAGHRVDLATTIDEARHQWQDKPFDAVLLDLNLPHSLREGSGLGNGRALA